jgi:hypothetical protein
MTSLLIYRRDLPREQADDAGFEFAQWHLHVESSDLLVTVLRHDVDPSPLEFDVVFARASEPCA